MIKLALQTLGQPKIDNMSMSQVYWFTANVSHVETISTHTMDNVQFHVAASWAYKD